MQDLCQTFNGHGTVWIYSRIRFLGVPLSNPFRHGVFGGNLFATGVHWVHWVHWVHCYSSFWFSFDLRGSSLNYYGPTSAGGVAASATWVPLQGASDRFDEASRWWLYIAAICYVSCDADRSQHDSEERRAIKTCRLPALDVNVRHMGGKQTSCWDLSMCFCRGSFAEKPIQVHGLHNSQDLPKGSCDSPSFQGFACTEAPCADGCRKSSATSARGGADAASSRRARKRSNARKVKWCCAFWISRNFCGLSCKIWSCWFRML